MTTERDQAVLRDERAVQQVQELHGQVTDLMIALTENEIRLTREVMARNEA